MKKTNILITLLFFLFIVIGVCNAEITPCTPNCAGKQCGDDGCGGICGDCPASSIHFICDNGQCISCPSGVCSAGENCPEDATGCPSSYDTKCYEPTCINGCGKSTVIRGETDEACFGSSGCVGHSCKCDGAPEPYAKCVALLIDSIQFCRGIEFSDSEDFTKPIHCIEPVSEFTTTDTAAYIIIKMSLLAKDDEAAYTVSDPSGVIIDEESRIIPQDMGVWYDYREIMIADQGLQPGTYSFKVYANGDEIGSSSFVIVEDVSGMCEPQGFYCCPSPKICISAQDGICSSGACCKDETKCVTYSPYGDYFSRREITNCEEETDIGGGNLKGCQRVVKLYEYNIHGMISPSQTGVIYYRGVDVDCSDKTDVTIAYYEEETKTWIEKVTHVEKAATGDSYKATALLDYLGYVALIRTDECVPMLCTYGGYRTKPIGGYVNFGETITFELCGITSGCEATKNGVCNQKCIDGIDLDCKECTSAKGDCCLISYDGVCDLDCGPDVDPDCCIKPNKLCCPGSIEISGYSGCDKNCDTSDGYCSGCTPAGGDCCKADSDGVCDPDCPKLSNGVGYLDIDCCISNGISATNNQGDCCNAEQDGVCDCDCIAGLDVDCVISKDCCGNNLCSAKEGPGSCSIDCSYGDGICSPGEDCSNSPHDCGECPPPSDGGGS